MGTPASPVPTPKTNVSPRATASPKENVPPKPNVSRKTTPKVPSRQPSQTSVKEPPENENEDKKKADEAGIELLRKISNGFSKGKDKK